MKHCQLVIVVLLLCIGWFTPAISRAGRNRPVHIGALTSAWGATPSIVGLRDGLVELGYREDDDFVLGVRFTQGNIAALPVAARELVQYGADILYASADHAAKALQEVTTEIPIVFGAVTNPISLDLIQSFARPGGNITGVASLAIDLGPKRLQVFRDMIPGLKRVLLPYDAKDASVIAEVKTYREAARQLEIDLLERPVRTQEEARAILTKVRKSEVDGIFQTRCCGSNIPGFILDAISQQGIPAIFDAAFWVERGALASYGGDYYASGKQAARLVDKILKGAKPADIPVEVNSKIEFAINLKTAQALGLTIPPEILFQATKVIR